MNEPEQLTKEEKLNRRVRALERHVADLPTKTEIEEIVKTTMKDVLFETGKSTKAILLTAAVVIGALTVILGGAKAILGWLGFTYLK